MNLSFYFANCEDNRDPENKGRIKVSCPDLGLVNDTSSSVDNSVTVDNRSDWIHFFSPFGINAKMGFYVVPAIGDPVIMIEASEPILSKVNKSFYWIWGMYHQKGSGTPSFFPEMLCIYKGNCIISMEENQAIRVQYGSDNYIIISDSDMTLKIGSMEVKINNTAMEVGTASEAAVKADSLTLLYNAHTHIAPPGGGVTSVPTPLLNNSIKCNKLKLE